jgi:hypothetical protein
MANTYDADLVVDRLSDQAILVLQNKLAPLNAFSQDFGTDTLRPRATVQVEKSGTPATGQTNPTNYESGDTTNTNVAVTVSEYSQSFHVSSQELMQGHKLETKAANNLRALADDVWDVAAGLLDETVFTNTVVVATEAAIDADDLKTGWGTIAKSGEKNVVLSGPAFSRFLPDNRESFTPGSGAYGFDGFHLATKWDAAQDANTRGFFGGPNAIACASGLPDISPSVRNQCEAVRVIEIPDLNLAVQMVMWGSTASRATWVSYGVMFGAAVGDASALTLYQTS